MPQAKLNCAMTLLSGIPQDEANVHAAMKPDTVKGKRLLRELCEGKFKPAFLEYAKARLSEPESPLDKATAFQLLLDAADNGNGDPAASASRCDPATSRRSR